MTKIMQIDMPSYMFIEENNIHTTGVQNVPQLGRLCFIPIHINPTQEQKKYTSQNSYYSGQLDQLKPGEAIATAGKNRHPSLLHF